MLDSVTQSLWFTLALVVFLGFVFAAWVYWVARDAVDNFFRVLRKAWSESWEDSKNMTKEKMQYNLNYAERHNMPRRAAYWRRQIEKDFPEENN